MSEQTYREYSVEVKIADEGDVLLTQDEGGGECSSVILRPHQLVNMAAWVQQQGAKDD